MKEWLSGGLSRLAVALTVVASAGCGAKSPMAPAPLAGGVLAITCPAPAEATSVDGTDVPVSFGVPTTANGLAPVTSSCSLTSGDRFAVGSTTVSCQARDSAGQSAACSFTVMVKSPPRLTSTKFVAFGDSLTEGVVSLAPTLLALDLPASYPTVLRGLLRAQYPSQSVTVVNAGSAGEFASGDGLKRFGPTLAANTPEVVLLMEGTNDLLFAQRGIEPALSALDAMMRDAESRNIRVCLATIPPQRAGGARSRDLVAGLIPGFNDQVRALAVSHNAVLVDVYAGMKDDLSLIGVDDLHPTARGYEAMASIYRDAIAKAFEARATTSAYGAPADSALTPSRTIRSNATNR